jgi:hypothetical protein
MNEKFRSVTSHSSDDKIKIVYSWFGPRGPLWNTELPNILTFASSAEGVNPNMESRNFWVDDVWGKQFSKAKDKYELYPVPSIEGEDRRPFIYPFAMTWRVQFQQYFINKSGLFEFSHIPHWLIHLCRIGNGYILIDHSVEAFMSDVELDAMYSYFHEHHNLAMYKIIYLTGTVNATYVYEDYCKRKAIANIREHRMHVIPYASSYDIFHNFVTHGYNANQPVPTGDENSLGEVIDNVVEVVEPEYDVTVVPEKLFLSWNRRLRQHRVFLALILENLGVVDRSYISFAKRSDENSAQTFDGYVSETKLHGDQLYGIHFTGKFSKEVVNKFSNRLPLVIDGETDIHVMCEDFHFTKDFYTNSLVSLVTETNYDSVECTLTEKSFKPLFNKHPFLIVGAPGAMQGLRELGFKTFSDFWDESYDLISISSDRFTAIEKVLIEIASWNDEQILSFKLRVKPILDHNYNMFKKSGAIPVTNNIYEHITKNFNPEWTDWCNPSEGYCQHPSPIRGNKPNGPQYP